MRKTLNILLVPVIAILAVSCDKYLDVLPDQRAELNSVEKIQKLLVSAYPNRSYVRLCEIASDNCDDQGPSNPNTGVLLEDNSYWKPMNEADNDSNKNTWQQYYNAIAVANTALEAIENMGTPDELLPAKGEALMCRAYAHFSLTMLYCLPYHPEKSSQYAGITYMEKPETTLNPKYTRDDLKTVYDKISKDIEEALPLIDNSIYSVPKYHFNHDAAYAFAARFNLYYLRWDKVVEYAGKVLGDNPSAILRDWTATAALAWDNKVRCLDYINPEHEFNLMMIPLVTSIGGMFNAWSSTGSRFAHNNRVVKTETFRAKRPMGGPFDKWKASSMANVYNHVPFTWLDNYTNKVYMPKWYMQWEVANAVTGTGYARATLVAFTTNETLLCRAEAYIHLKQYDLALRDMNCWISSFYKVGSNGITPLTLERLRDVYGNPDSPLYIAEYTSETPTSRKAIHPHGFAIDPGDQEYMTQALLYCRRIETIADGLRWGDIKRYGIVVDRFDDTDYSDDDTSGWKLAATLDEKDLRRAMQIPQEVIEAGLEPNPRNEDSPAHPFRQ